MIYIYILTLYQLFSSYFMKKLLFYTLIFSFNITIFANSYDDFLKGIDQQNSPDLLAFLMKYRCGTDIEESIQKDFTDTVYTVVDDPKFPFIVKYDYPFDRLNNAQRLQKYFARNNFDNFTVPEKCLAIKNNKWCVVSKRIIAQNSKNQKPITLPEIQQLAQVATQTGFMDWKYNNILRTPDKKFVFIDTENRSFFHPCNNHDVKQHEILRFLRNCYAEQLEPEARQWLDTEIYTSQESLIKLPPQNF